MQIVGQLVVVFSHLPVFFPFGTQTSRIIGISPGGSAWLLEVPLSRSPPKRVLTARLDPCMEKKNPTQVRNERELILKLLDAVNSEEEYRYLQEELVLVENELAGFSSPNNEKEVQSQ